MIKVGWEDQSQGIVRIDFTPPWTPDDYAMAQLQMRELVEGIATRLDLLNVVHAENEGPPPGMIGLIQQAVRQMPRQFIMIITVNGGMIAEMTKDRLDRAVTLSNTPFKLRTAESIAEARAMIARDRAGTGSGA